MARFSERLFVWTGGALFVGSLILTAWTFAVPFRVERPATLWPNLALDTLLLSVFALHHSLFARESIKAALARLVPERLLRSFYVWVASLLLAAVCLSWQPIGGRLYALSGWRAWLLLVVQLAGVWLIMQSVRAIDALELAGIRMSKATDVALQRHGVYGLVRHPLYFGWLLIVFGTANLTGDRFAFAVMTTAYLAVAIPWEERSLERHFGDVYQAYRRQVRWKLVPFIY